MVGTVASTAILSKGLTCGKSSACQFGTLITTPFDLFCKREKKPTKRIASGGGGPYPGPAWNKFSPGQLWQLYKPINTIDELGDLFKQIDTPSSSVSSVPYYIVPADQEHQFLDLDTRNISIEMSIQGRRFTKEFLVSGMRRKNVQISDIEQAKPSTSVNIQSVHKTTSRKAEPSIVKIRKSTPKIKSIKNKYNDE